jgi:hypothetical protein
MYIKNYSGWQKIMEQDATKEIIHRPWTEDPESVKIMTLFTGEFIPSIIGPVDDLTFLEYRTKLSKISADQLDSSIGFFKNKGYTQPNEKIKKFQQDMMNNTNYSTFTNVEGKTDKFDDGVFGRATSKAIIDYMIQSMGKVDQDMKVSAMQASFGKDGEPTRKAAAKTYSTKSDIETETGTQHVD